MEVGTLGVYSCLFLALYFEVLLLIIWLEKRPSQRDEKLPKRYPTVAMMVPCWNEEKTIAKTLKSLLELDYPKDKLSILVIDDGSTDHTGAIAQAMALEHPQIEYLYKKNGGKYTALNMGLKHTQAELVGCLDADSFVVRDGLLEMVKTFEEQPDAYALTPVMKVFRPRSVLELMQAVEYTFGIFYKKMFDNLAAINVLPGPFSMYRRDVFNKIGFFKHAHNTEDMEIAFRMHQHGLRIANAHTAVVYTTVPRTVPALVKQRTRWSQGFLQNSYDYRHMYFNPRFGNFGMLVLPFGLVAFFAGLYTAAYSLYLVFKSISRFVFDHVTTHVPVTIPTQIHFNWFYLDTSMLTFLIVVVFGMTLTAILLGNRIAKSELTVKSFFSYFAFFGFIAPLWLAKAAWGAARAKQSAWR